KRLDVVLADAPAAEAADADRRSAAVPTVHVIPLKSRRLMLPRSISHGGRLQRPPAKRPEEDSVEPLPVEPEGADRRPGNHRRGSGDVHEQRDLAEEGAGAERAL